MNLAHYVQTLFLFAYQIPDGQFPTEREYLENTTAHARVRIWFEHLVYDVERKIEDGVQNCYCWDITNPDDRKMLTPVECKQLFDQLNGRKRKAA